MECIYLVRAGNFEGTAFVMNGFLYTAHHNVEGHTSVEVIDVKGNEYCVRVLAVSPLIDVAILAAPPCDHTLYPGTITSSSCSTISHPAGRYWERSEGVLIGTRDPRTLEENHMLANVDTILIVAKISIQKGSSGAPLLQDGHVIGMINGYDVKKPQDALIIPISAIPMKKD